MTEARIVLPGAQALLGFQFITFLTDGFEKLSRTSQILHFVALALVALCAILLMAVPAYHRIVEKGEDTEHFQKLFHEAACLFRTRGLKSDAEVRHEKCILPRARFFIGLP